MAFITVGELTIPPAGTQLQLFPAVAGRRDRGFVFLLELLSPLSSLGDTYFLVVPTILSDLGRVEVALRERFYPKGFLFLATVAIPEGPSFNPTDIQIGVVPRRRFQSPPATAPLQLRLYFEDDIQSRDIAIPL